MKIFVKIKAGRKEEKVERLDDNYYAISVKAPPIEGRANVAVINLLAEYFKLPKSRIRISSGHKSRQKVIEVIS